MDVGEDDLRWGLTFFKEAAEMRSRRRWLLGLESPKRMKIGAAIARISDRKSCPAVSADLAEWCAAEPDISDCLAVMRQMGLSYEDIPPRPLGSSRAGKPRGARLPWGYAVVCGRRYL